MLKNLFDEFSIEVFPRLDHLTIRVERLLDITLNTV
jgi:hypothetical protein